MKRLILATVLMMVVVGQAWCFDPSGDYSFKEKGMSGDMVVSETTNMHGESEIKVKLDTMNSQTNMCEIEATGGRSISSDQSIDALFVVPADGFYPEIKFEITFTPKGAKIKTLTDGPNGCGLNVYFDGKWSKVVAKRKGGKK